MPDHLLVHPNPASPSDLQVQACNSWLFRVHKWAGLPSLGVHSKILTGPMGEDQKSEFLVVENAQTSDEEGNHRKQLTQSSPKPPSWPPSPQPPPQAHGPPSMSETARDIALSI